MDVLMVPHSEFTPTNNVSLRRYSTWRIGGAADYFASPDTPEQVVAAYAWAEQRALPVVFIGGGSNLLFDDQGVRGLVLKLGDGFNSITIDGARVFAGAAAPIGDLSWAAAHAGLAGLEHTVGIPGTLGGLAAMNGGSRRRALGDNIISVTSMDRLGNVYVTPCEDCGFDYRTSVFQKNGQVIIAVELELEPDTPEAIVQRMQDDLDLRARSFPLESPSCGSVFKSNTSLYKTFGPPGMIIDKAGFKGRTVGGIQISEMHGNFFVNLGEATCADALQMIRWTREQVRTLTGRWLECEVRYVSPEGAVMPAHLAVEKQPS